jgi:hypothetical protein
MVDTLFRMIGSREILPLFAGSNVIERHISALEESIESNPSLAFDLSRSLVESVCKTILTDRGENPENLGFKDLLKRTYSVCQLVPNSHTTKPEVIASLQNIIEGFETVIQALTNLRNSEGIASHGKDAFTLQLETAQARLAAQSADTIVRYLYIAHKNYQTPAQVRQLRYDDNLEFNDYIDENNDKVQIFELIYQPSEVLFSVDQDAYRSYLAEYIPGDQAE